MKKIFAVLFISFALSACSPPPEGAVNEAIEDVKENIALHDRGGRQSDLDSIELGRSKKLTLTSGDVNSGILEQWCLSITFLSEFTDTGSTIKQEIFYLMSLKEGGWNTYNTEYRGPEEDINDLRDAHWRQCLDR